MAQLKGSIQFTGSIGTIRSYYNKKLKRYILSTKGGAPKEKIMNSPVFARTRENMSEFKGCGMWSSQLRKSLIKIAHLHEGYYFSEIVALAKSIQKHDLVSPRGFRSIVSSESSALLKQINFNKVYPFDRVLSHWYEVLFSADKRTVTLYMPGFRSFSHLNWPASYQSFRFSLVIAQLPDYVWKEDELQYRPLYNDMEMLSVATFSDWYPNNTSLIDISLSASFALPALQLPGTTVVVAMGIEVSSDPPGVSLSSQQGSGTMKILQCFE
jgi:hypothetical protein